MDETKLCKVCCVSSMVFYPVVLIAIFWGLQWAMGLLSVSLFVAVTKTHFNKVEDYLVNLKIPKIIAHFLIFNCIFGIWYLANYLYNKDNCDETNFIFDVSWVLVFSVISILFIKINWQLYPLVVIFIGIMQNMVQKSIT